MATINGCKVFSATKSKDREALGEAVTSWLADHPGVDVVEAVVTQSSDEAFHCLTITLWYADRPAEGDRGDRGAVG